MFVYHDSFITLCCDDLLIFWVFSFVKLGTYNFLITAYNL